MNALELSSTIQGRGLFQGQMKCKQKLKVSKMKKSIASDLLQITFKQTLKKKKIQTSRLIHTQALTNLHVTKQPHPACSLVDYLQIHGMCINPV